MRTNLWLCGGLAILSACCCAGLVVGWLAWAAAMWSPGLLASLGIVSVGAALLMGEVVFICWLAGWPTLPRPPRSA